MKMKQKRIKLAQRIRRATGVSFVRSQRLARIILKCPIDLILEVEGETSLDHDSLYVVGPKGRYIV